MLKRITNGAAFLYDVVKNEIAKKQLTYIVEAIPWTVNYDGKHLAHSLNKLRLLSARTATNPLLLRNKVVHFGSFRTIYFRNKPYRLHPSNKAILTVFHIQPDNAQYQVLAELAHRVAIVHTSAEISKQDLVRLGVSPEKITVIPLGVDNTLFKPVADDEKRQIRVRLGIPQESVVIGSFQKDGVGWGKGMKPKLEKGPDVFIETVAQLQQHFPVYVLLSGPSRGYVEDGLSRLGVPFTTLGYLKTLQEIAKCYAALDLYIIASRVEGGPKALVEAWASGVPVVSTRMGMAADIAEDGIDTLLADVNDSTVLAQQAAHIFNDSLLRQKLITNGLSKVQHYTWDRIAQRYYDEMYKKLI